MSRICPLLLLGRVSNQGDTAGSLNVDLECTDDCAWWIKENKACAIFMIGYYASVQGMMDGCFPFSEVYPDEETESEI